MMVRSLLFLSGLAGVTTCCRAQVTPEWTWIPSLQLTCRDGSPTGIGLRHQDKSPSATANPGLMIFLEGGGVCVNALTCGADNPASWSQANFNTWKAMSGYQGMFSLSTSAFPPNPFATWIHVYVPYCSGDLHGGMKSNVAIPGVAGIQTYQGYDNIRKVMAYLRNIYLNGTATDVSDVALVGNSAGAAGVLLNYEQVADVVAGPIIDIADASPIMYVSALCACFLQIAYVLGPTWNFLHQT
jgi:hypothetical protein